MAAWPIGFSKVEFQEAIDFFRGKVAIEDDAYDELTEKAKKRAFKVAGVGQMDLVSEVWRAIDKAVKEGTDFAEFKADVSEKIEKAWAGTVEDPASRIETIFRTNVQVAYGAGRWKQATDPEVIDSRPYLKAEIVLDGRTSKICRPLEDVCLPTDDPFWLTHVPPLHHRCRTTVVSLTKDEAEEAGITKKKPKVAVAKGFGAPPDTDEWEPDEADYPSEIWSAFEKRRAEESP